MTSRHAGGRTGRGALFGAVVVIAGLLAVSAVGSLPASAASAAGPGAPLSTADVGSPGDVAIVAMGHLRDQANTFWQLFYRPSGGRWLLRTPPGVADNGGLVAAYGGGSTATITAGFVPTAELTFSPLASTTNAGASWTTGTVMPFGLEDVPDALSGEVPAGLWALVRGGQGAGPIPVGGAVVVGDTTTGRWRTLVTTNDLARSAPGRRCGLQALTALAATAPPSVVLGGSCRVAGQVGIFGGGLGRWSLLGPRLRSGQVTVLRLDIEGLGVDALLAVRRGGSTQIVAAWSRTAAGPWRLTPGLSGGDGLCSSSTTGAVGTSSTSRAVGYVVLVRTRTGCQAAVANPGTARWRILPRLPPSTTVVVAGAGGTADALTVRSTLFADFRLTSAGTWRRVQTVHVPIQFGSSS